MSYADRVADELKRYRDVENVHDLPAIYHYWSGGHIDPLLAQLGYSSLDQFLLDPVAERCRSGAPIHVVSLGSGNGELELGLARSLQEAGHDNFHIRRLELNGAMRERAQHDAAAAGLSAHLIDEEADLNAWEPSEQHDVVIANHSLHHVCELERLFEQVRASASPDCVFIVNDMIGRNGHMRWPEALDLVQHIWATMPDRYRYNHQLRRHEAVYDNWDCSTEGFEGIRAQDILRLLNEYFHPAVFLAFANVIDLFVDRGFGHNFDPERAEDRNFIDAVARLDEGALALGIVKPTHLMAHYVMHDVECDFVPPLSPAFAVRPVPPDVAAVPEHVQPSASHGGVGGDPATIGTPTGPARPAPRSMGSHAAAMMRSLAYSAAKAGAGVIPPIRRLRAQRDALAAEVEALKAATPSEGHDGA